jgi:hypothetical protein
VRWPGFIGPSAENRATALNVERTINLYPETVGAGTGKSAGVLHSTPGLAVFATVDAARNPVRALFAQDGRAFAVVGDAFVELFSDGTTTTHGTVRGYDEVASLCSNGTGGHQIFITSAGGGYIFDLDTDTFTELTGADIPSPMGLGVFCDGYFLVNVAGTPTFRLSDLEDGLTWDPLDLQQRNYSTDELRGIIVNHRELWLMGSQTSEVWYNTGDADMPFQPIAGAFVEQGIAAADTAVRCDNSIIWLGEDERGGGIVWRANGYTPMRVSTHAVEYALQGLDLAAARAWAYQDEGHTFYVLSVPGLDTSWVYDMATQLWHERAAWDDTTMTWSRHLGHCHAWAFGRHLVGDRLRGIIYELNLEYADDNGAPLRRLRQVPFISDEQAWLFYQRFQLDLEAGRGLETGQGSDPQVMLQWSDDGGHTWSNERWVSAGALGAYRRRAVWRQLGRARDRVFRVVTSDPVPVSWLDAYVDVSKGTS